MNKQPSILDGINVPDKNAKAAPRPSLSDSVNNLTSGDWTPGQKKIAAGLGVFAALGVAIGGAWLAINHRPLDLPKSFEEGAAAMQTTRFANMTPDRQGQYVAEMARMMPTLTEEQRRQFREDPSMRSVLEQVREQQMDEAARRIARGERPEDIFASMRDRMQRDPNAPRPDRGPRDPNAQQPGQQAQGGARGTNRGQMSEDRRRAIANRIGRSIQSGNPQSLGLRGEMMSRFGGGPGRGMGGGGQRPPASNPTPPR